MNFDDLTDEQKAQARACSTPEELINLAKTAGHELSDDELERIAGSGEWYEPCSDNDSSDS